MLKSIERKEILSWKLLLRQAMWKLRLFHASLARQESTPVFILSSPRTGSSLLGDLCASHPELDDRGEVLNQRIARGLYHRSTGSAAVVRHIRQHLAISSARCAVIKLHFNHLQHRRTSIMDLIQAFPDAVWIVLYRRSLIDQYISLKLAVSTRTFKDTIRRDELVWVDEKEWMSFACNEKSKVRSAVSLLRENGQRYLPVAYEDVSAQALHFLDKLSAILEISAPLAVHTTLRKQETRQLGEIISNFDSVHHCIDDTLDITDIESTHYL